VPAACQWRLDHIGDYERSRPWMAAAADLVLDITGRPPAEAADRIAAAVEPRLAGASR